MSESKPSRKVRYRATPVALGLIYFLAFLFLTLLLEGRDQFEWSSSSCFAPSGDSTPMFYAPIYRAFLNSIGEDTKSQVTVIAIEAGLIDIQQNLCHGRLYLADLIQAVAAQHPSAIVIDKFFSQGACGSDDNSTKELVQAVKNAGVPVVVGESTDVASQETDDSCLVQKPQLDFSTPNVHYGLLRLNANKEQIPLGWKVLPQQPPDTGPSTLKDSLSLVAAIIAAPKKESDFRSLQSGARQPYARTAPKVPEEASTVLLCGARNQKMRAPWPLACAPNVTKQDLPHKVVLIGAENEVDHWTLLGEPIYGFRLQALYIDALLSGHYLRAPPGTLPVLLFLGFLIALEGVPVLASWLYLQRQWPMPRFVTSHTRWVWIFSSVFFVSTILCFSLKHYLPPLLMLFGVLLACITRLVIAGLGYAEQLMVPEERN